jgi:hypothetical protein
MLVIGRKLPRPHHRPSAFASKGRYTSKGRYGKWPPRKKAAPAAEKGNGRREPAVFVFWQYLN